MMTNQNPAQNYEASIFNQLVKISEENAVIKYRIDLIKSQVNKIPNIETILDNIEARLENIEKIPAMIKSGIRTLVITIIIGIIINIFSTPILASLFN